MRKLIILILLLCAGIAQGQTTYQLNYDSIRVNKTAGTGGTSLYGKVYLKNVSLGLTSDSILVVRNGRIFKVLKTNGTVTSVAKGFGLLADGTITTTGTVAVDSAVMRTTANSRTLAQTQTALNLKANLASPTFTGVPAAPTATAGTNTTQLASTAFVTNGIATSGALYLPLVGGELSGDLGISKANARLYLKNPSSLTSGTRGDIAIYNSSTSTVATITAYAITDNVGTGWKFSTRPAAGVLTEILDLSNIALFYGDITIRKNSPVHFLRATSSLTSGSRGDFNVLNSDDSSVGLIRFTANTDNVGTGIEIYNRPVAGSLTKVFDISSAAVPRFSGLSSGSTQMVVAATDGTLSVQSIPGGGGGGTVISVGVASSNGLAGTSSGGTNPTLTISTSVSGLVKANGTAFSAAVNGTDYIAGVTGTANRISANTGVSPIIDISSAYVGQASITTLGTVGAGTWQATAIADSYISSASTWNAKGNGSVTSVGATAGTGISVSGSPITTSGSITITNTAPDQTVILTNGGNIPISGTYPNFTITNGITNNNQLSNGNNYITAASPALTGSPTAPTQTAGDNSTKIATTAYVNSLVSTGIFSGTFTFSGTGSATVFTFDDIDEAGMLITPTSAGAAGAHYLTGDNNGCGGLCNRIIITFLAAPASGTDNITFNYIKKL